MNYENLYRKKVRRDFKRPNGHADYGVSIDGNDYIVYFKDWLTIKGVYEFGIVVNSETPIQRDELVDVLLNFIKSTPELVVENSRGYDRLNYETFYKAAKPNFSYWDGWFNEMSSYREWMFFHSDKEWEHTYNELKKMDQLFGLKNLEVQWDTSETLPKPSFTSKVLDKTTTMTFGDIEFTILYNDDYFVVSNVNFKNGILNEFDESKLDSKIREAIVEGHDWCRYDVVYSTEHSFTLKTGIQKYLYCHKREDKLTITLKMKRDYTTKEVLLSKGYDSRDDYYPRVKGCIDDESSIPRAHKYDPRFWVKAKYLKEGKNTLSYNMEFDISDGLK